MVRGDKSEAGAPSAAEGEEIDRIMKEIEDLEKKMDTTGEEETVAKRTEPEATAVAETETTEADDATEDDLHTSKVVPMRPALADTLAETDAVPARDEPLVRAGDGSEAGGLSLRIGGCTEVNLEFTRAGVSVQLSCSDDGLSITTDQGAEFRIPFKRSA
ncbi:MAG: hypothetical protein HY075_07120 [Deltaproteobacteria bacterium]|nr:hypothetical protein [Deltaproteobacteria bacterium]